MDPDLDFIARDEAGQLVDAAAVLRVPEKLTLESLSSKQLSHDEVEGDWLERNAIREQVETLSGRQIGGMWNMRYGFCGGYTWRHDRGYGVGYTDIAPLFLQGLVAARTLSHRLSHPLIASEGWEKYLPPQAVPTSLEPPRSSPQSG
jgi:hypothetical protein